MSPWIDTLPALPLARGVPVIAWGSRRVVSDLFEDGSGFYEGLVEYEFSAAPWRVDLSASAGLAYVLPILRQACGGRWTVRMQAITARWLLGQTTEEDRAHVAEQLALVVVS